MLALADNANDQGECWPSLSHLAEKCQLSRRAIINNLQALHKKGWIHWRSGGPDIGSNRYAISLPKEPKEDGSAPNAPPSERRAPEVVNHVHQGSERRAPEPSNNRHKEPSGEKPLKFVSELNAQIQAAKEEMDRLKCASFDGDGNWSNEKHKQRYRELKAKCKGWTEEMLSM